MVMGSPDASGGGMMGMQPVARVEIPAGGSLQLKPGSYHVLLIGLVKDLKAGDTIDLTVKFERAGGSGPSIPRSRRSRLTGYFI